MNIIKVRMGDIVLKKVGEKWHVYRVGPAVVVDTLEEALVWAQRLNDNADKFERKAIE